MDYEGVQTLTKMDLLTKINRILGKATVEQLRKVFWLISALEK